MAHRFVACALALALARSVTAQVQAPWFGVWEVNLDKSVFSAPPDFKRQTCRIEPWRDRTKVTYDLVHARGGITHLEWVGKLDGTDSPLQGIDDYAVTNAYRTVDDRRYDVTQKVDGTIVALTRVTVSADGATLTSVTSFGNGQPSSTIVFERARQD